MNGLQACIYKDFTCIHKFLWIQVSYEKFYLYLQGNFTKILYKSKRLVYTSKLVQVSLQIK